MISHSHRFILITPPKTGSTSIAKCLENYIEIYEVEPKGPLGDFGYTEKPGGVLMSKHKKKKIREYFDDYNRETVGIPNPGSKIVAGTYGCTLINRSLRVYPTYAKYGLIRNPYERMVSWWKFGSKNPDFNQFMSGDGGGLR
jgi:hypothetical protein